MGKLVIIIKSLDRKLVGSIAKVLEKSNSKEKAVVQLESTLELMTLDFDDICEYIEF